jgi:hypothetical protein
LELRIEGRDRAEWPEGSSDEAPTYGLHEFMEGSKLAVSPLDIVFKEKFSTLRDAQGNDIVEWF